MFLFFVSLAPNPDFDQVSEWALRVSSGGFAVCCSSFILGSRGGRSVLAGGLTSRGVLAVSLWTGGRAFFMAGLAAYLFFVVVVVSKLAYRDGGALRGC